MKKLILFGIVMLLFSFSVVSLSNDDVSDYWYLEETNTPYNNEVNDSNNFSISNDPTRANGINNFGQYFDRTSRFYLSTASRSFDKKITDSFSVSIWLNMSPIGAGDYGIWAFQRQSGYFDGVLYLRISGSSDTFFVHAEGDDNGGLSWCGVGAGQLWDNSTWHNVIVAFDGSNPANSVVYLNGVSYACDLTTPEGLAGTYLFGNGDFDRLIVGGLTLDDGEAYLGTADEIMILNKKASQTDADEIWAGGFYPFVPSDPSATLNLSSPQPPHNSQFSTSELNFNLTYNSTYEANCSIYINDTLNQTIENFVAGTNIEVDFNLTYDSSISAHYNFLIGCINLDNDTNSSKHTFFIDNVDPVLQVDTTLSSGLSISYRDANITSDINVSDDNLWGFNITIDESNLVFNITNIAGSSYNYYLNFNPEDYGLSIGEHILNFWVSDSHTTNTIPDYYFEKNPLSKSITYEFNGGWIRVKPTNKGLFAGFDTWKSKDRYVFEFERDLMGKLLYGTDLEFEISSSHKLEDIDSEFPGHIISPDLRKWIDFDSQYKDAIITTTRIDSKTFKVFIEGIEDDLVLFNSLGGLNVIEENFTFYYGNFTENYTEDNILETESTIFSINFSINDSYVGDIDALLSWNGTYYTATTKTSSSDSIYFERSITSDLIVSDNETNKSFLWNYTISNAGAGNNIYNNTTDTRNQTLYKMIVSNCSDGISTTAAINYSVLDIIFGTPAWVVSEASFTIWNGSSSTARTYGLNWDNSTSFNLCIWPVWATFYTDYRLLYTGYGDTNSRIRTNDTLDNVTDYVTLYITAEGEDISINVVDEDDNGLENYNVEAWIYSVADNNYTLVSEESTDPDGLAIMKLYTAGEDEYRFLVYDGSTLLYTSSRFKLYQTEYTFRIVLGTVPNSTLIELQNLEYSLSRDIIGENFSLTWNDVPTGLITNITLTVMEMNATNQAALSSQSSIASSGTLGYNVTRGYGVYIAYVYVTSSGDGLEYLIDSISLDIREEWEIFGTDALIMSFFFIGTMIFTGLSFSGEIAIIAMIFSMIVFYALGFIQVSLTGVVSIIISAIIILVRMKR